MTTPPKRRSPTGTAASPSAPTAAKTAPATAKAAPQEKSTADKMKSKAQSTARAARETAEKTASQVMSQAEHVADDAIASGRAEADRFLTTGKSRAEDVIRSVGRAIEASSQSLEDDGMRATAGYVRAAATGLHRAADEIDEFDTGGVTGRVESFVRSQPMLTVGALALAGFVLAGALNSSKRRS